MRAASYGSWQTQLGLKTRKGQPIRQFREDRRGITGAWPRAIRKFSELPNASTSQRPAEYDKVSLAPTGNPCPGRWLGIVHRFLCYVDLGFPWPAGPLPQEKYRAQPEQRPVPGGRLGLGQPTAAPAKPSSAVQLALQAFGIGGAPARIRTWDRRIRSPMLYPTELRARPNPARIIGKSTVSTRVGAQAAASPPPINCRRAQQSS